MMQQFEHLNEKAKLIVENLNHESIDVYIFLTDEFKKGDILKNYVFRFVYRSFYRLDNAGLTDDFKDKYFEYLEDHRENRDIQIEAIARELFKLPNRKGQNSLQFSFVTKLANTINHEFPIYDLEIAKMYSFKAPYTNKPFDVRLSEYMKFYNLLTESYKNILAKNTLEKVFDEFHIKFKNNGAIPDIKILDFIMWSAGKLKS